MTVEIRTMTEWDSRWLSIARQIAYWSLDPVSKVGAIIVSDDNNIIASGYNSFPRGIDTSDEDRWIKPDKHDWVEHAERNAIYNAAREGRQTWGERMYISLDLPLCNDCAKAIIQAGIERIICSHYPFPLEGEEKRKNMRAEELLDHGGVQVVWRNT